jgi:tetratricopeptide (TPR) repeat protein
MSNDDYDELRPDEHESFPAEDAPDEVTDEEEDTKPKAPPGLRETITAPEVIAPPLLPAMEPPRDPLHDTAEMRPVIVRAPARPLLLGVVMIGMLCLCISLVSLAGFAGYRDGLATNDRRITQTLATGIAEQYALGVTDLENGRASLAEARFAWIVETLQPAPDYQRDSAQLLALARTMQAYTPTPQATATAQPSPSPSPTTEAITPSPQATEEAADLQDPDTLYQQAQTAMSVRHFEEAMEWLDALQGLAPDYRTVEVRAMYLAAATEQGKIYIRGQNEDGADMLARGVRLIYVANELGPVEPPSLLYEADFAERYLNARNYVAGGNFEAALPVLEYYARKTVSGDITA